MMRRIAFLLSAASAALSASAAHYDAKSAAAKALDTKKVDAVLKQPAPPPPSSTR